MGIPSFRTDLKITIKLYFALSSCLMMKTMSSSVPLDLQASSNRPGGRYMVGSLFIPGCYVKVVRNQIKS